MVVSDHQRCIEALPGVDRLRVADASVTRLTSDTPTTEERVTLEVEVSGDEAESLESKLRADGYRVRRRER